MTEETVTTYLTHKRIETPTEIKIVVNTLYQTVLLVFILIAISGLVWEKDGILYLGIFLMAAQWIYSLRNWNPVFREIKRAETEKRLATFGNKRSINNPFTYIIQKGSRTVLSDTLDE